MDASTYSRSRYCLDDLCNLVIEVNTVHLHRNSFGFHISSGDVETSGRSGRVSITILAIALSDWPTISLRRHAGSQWRNFRDPEDITNKSLLLSNDKRSQLLEVYSQDVNTSGITDVYVLAGAGAATRASCSSQSGQQPASLHQMLS